MVCCMRASRGAVDVNSIVLPNRTVGVDLSEVADDGAIHQPAF